MTKKKYMEWAEQQVGRVEFPVDSSYDNGKSDGLEWAWPLLEGLVSSLNLIAYNGYEHPNQEYTVDIIPEQVAQEALEKFEKQVGERE